MYVWVIYKAFIDRYDVLSFCVIVIIMYVDSGYIIAIFK